MKMGLKKREYDILILNLLSGEIILEDRNKLNKWLSASEDNRTYFASIEKIWNCAYNPNDKEFDIEYALQKVSARISEIEAERAMSKQKKIFLRCSKYVARAAIACLLIGLAYYSYFQMNKPVQEQTYIASSNTQSAFVLPDGSSVYMNKGAKINFPEKFSNSERTVSFEGEGYFVVVKNQEKPFRVLCNKMGVEVLGTEFNIKADCESDKYIVDLVTGKVRIFSFDENIESQKELLTLLPGERATFDLSTLEAERTVTSNQNFMAWKTGVLEFLNTPLTEVISSLEDTFKTSIETDSPIEDLYLTARFENEDFESIVKAIETIFEIKLK